MNEDNEDDLADFGESFGDEEFSPEDFCNAPLGDFGDPFADRGLALWERFGEFGFDDLDECVSADAGLDNFEDFSVEHGLSKVLEVGLSPSAEAGRCLFLNIFAIHILTKANGNY